MYTVHCTHTGSTENNMLCTCVPLLWLVGPIKCRSEGIEWLRWIEWLRDNQERTTRMMTGSGWRASQRKWAPMRPIERETGECQNTMSVECRNGRESHSLSWISPTRAVWGASANRVGRCVSRVPIHPFIFLIFIANYLISYLAAFSHIDLNP